MLCLIRLTDGSMVVVQREEWGAQHSMDGSERQPNSPNLGGLNKLARVAKSH